MRCFVMAVVVSLCAACASTPAPQADVVLPSDSTVPRPLSAVVVTECGLAVALFVQLDPTHLLRADPRQSDLFTAIEGQQQQSGAGPMPWTQAYELAASATLSSHVVMPCRDDPSI